MIKKILLTLLIASIPFSGFALFTSGDTFNFTTSYLILLILILVFIFSFIVNYRNNLTRFAPGLKVYLICLCAPIFLSFIAIFFFRTFNEYQYLKSILHIAFFFLGLMALINFFNSEDLLNHFINSFIFISCLSAIFGVVQFFFYVIWGVALTFDFNVASGQEQVLNILFDSVRPTSFFPEAGLFSNFVCVGLIMTFVKGFLFEKDNNLFVKLFLVFLIIIQIFAIIISLSASAIVVLPLSFLFLAYIYQVSIARIIIHTILLFVLVFTISFIEISPEIPNPIEVVFNRFYGLSSGDYVSGESFDTRNAELLFAKQLIISSNLLGVGFGQSASYLKEYTSICTGGISSFYGVIFAELGFFGFSLIVLSFLYIHYLLSCYQKFFKFTSNIGQLIFIARCIFFIDCLYLNFFGGYVSARYFIVLWFVFSVLGYAKTLRYLSVNKVSNANIANMSA